MSATLLVLSLCPTNKSAFYVGVLREKAREALAKELDLPIVEIL